MKPVFKQGSPGISVDDFTNKNNFFPNHIKIDVDGNEYLVLCGAKNTLKNPLCKSVLIEMFDQHPEYDKCLEIFKNNGFVLLDKTHSAMFDGVLFQAENHIFIKN